MGMTIWKRSYIVRSFGDGLTVTLEEDHYADEVEDREYGKEHLSEAGERWCRDEVGDVGEEIGEADASGDCEPLRTTTPLPESDGLTESEG